LYKEHQDATLIGCDILENEKYTVETLPKNDHRHLPDVIDSVNISVTKKDDGSLTATLCNVNHLSSVPCSLSLVGGNYTSATGRILTSEKFDDMNSFDEPDKITVKDFEVKLSDNTISFTLPPFSTVSVSVR
jgi:alpha-N-arabinofuranosidase